MALSIDTLLANRISDITLQNIDGKNTTATEAVSSEFEKELQSELSKMSESQKENSDLSEMTKLLEALDNSVLGAVIKDENRVEFAKELAGNPQAAKDVINELAAGHMLSIVTTSSDDDESESVTESVKNSVTAEGEAVSTETLAENLETIMAGINMTVSV